MKGVSFVMPNGDWKNPPAELKKWKDEKKKQIETNGPLYVVNKNSGVALFTLEGIVYAGFKTSAGVHLPSDDWLIVSKDLYELGVIEKQKMEQKKEQLIKEEKLASFLKNMESRYGSFGGRERAQKRKDFCEPCLEILNESQQKLPKGLCIRYGTRKCTICNYEIHKNKAYGEICPECSKKLERCRVCHVPFELIFEFNSKTFLLFPVTFRKECVILLLICSRQKLPKDVTRLLVKYLAKNYEKTKEGLEMKDPFPTLKKLV